MIRFCFRQTCDNVHGFELQEAEEGMGEPWQAVRERLHHKLFGSLLSKTDRMSQSKYLSGICLLRGFLGDYDAQADTIAFNKNNSILEPTSIMLPGDSVVLCRSAPTPEMRASQGRYYAAKAHTVRRSHQTSARQLEHHRKYPIPEPLYITDAMKSDRLFRDMIQLWRYARQCSFDFQEETQRSKSLDRPIYDVVAVQNPDVSRRNPRGIPASMLREATTDEERKHAMIDAQGRFVIRL
jgi:hypothetical protein